MRENLGGANNARHPAGHPHAGDHCTNSGTCLIACCYINALGKVLLRGGPPKGRRDFVRFKAFLSVCMSDFVLESAGRTWPPTPKGRPGDGVEWLYEVYRCGFVHQAHPDKSVAKWGRFHPPPTRYWVDRRGHVVLNIDELAAGFERGLQAFEALARREPDLRIQFGEYLEAE